MDAAAVQQVRSFNRTVAERIGALNERFLGLGRPLSEARLIWEIGRDGADVRELRGRLGLDSGYLSRLLRSLERQGLASVGAGRPDGRVRRAHLTPAGLSERDELDRRSDALAAGILEKLSDRQRAALVAAMAEVECLLQASMVDFGVEDPASADAKWCLDQYYAELRARFENGFDASLTTSTEPPEVRPPRGLLAVARMRGRAVGCGALKFHGDWAELKRFWVAPEVRGLGVGRQMLREMERLAAGAAAAVIRLDTNRVLSEAITLYRRSGYVEIGPFNSDLYAHHWFEKRLPTTPG
jgi:DNA-binding MarR family transcriptional regulator